MSSGAHSKRGAHNRALIPKAKKRLLRRIGPLTVWLVNGELIRSRIFIDFTEGGNSHAYPWMPQREIWIDDVDPKELPFTLLHELHEYIRMSNGEGYDKAHESANRVEQQARNGASIEALMKAEVAKLSKKEQRYG